MNNIDFVNDDVKAFFNGPINPFSIGAFIHGDGDPRNIKNRVLDIFRSFGIIPQREKPIKCPNCDNNLLRTITDASRRLGWRYRCSNSHSVEPCTNTFLSYVRFTEIGADALFYLIYSWLELLSITKAAEYSQVYGDIALKWYRKLQNISVTIAWHDYHQIGGPHDMVEVGTTKLFRKNSPIEPILVIGGVSRVTNKVFLKIIPERTEDVVLPILQDYIDCDSFICTKRARAYNACDVAFEGHGVIDRRLLGPLQFAYPGRFHPACLVIQRNYVETEIQPYRVHLQNLNIMWKWVKKFVSKCTNRNLVDRYLGEFMYRQNVLHGLRSRGKLQRLLVDIQRAYPGVGKMPMSEDYENCGCCICNED